MTKRNKIKQVINEIIELAKKVYPEVEYVTYSGGHSGVDATIEFFSPAKYEDKLDKVLRPRAADALYNNNVFISVLTLNKRYRKKAG